jgi:hypothetical protein
MTCVRTSFYNERASGPRAPKQKEGSKKQGRKPQALPRKCQTVTARGSAG